MSITWGKERAWFRAVWGFGYSSRRARVLKSEHDTGAEVKCTAQSESPRFTSGCLEFNRFTNKCFGARHDTQGHFFVLASFICFSGKQISIILSVRIPRRRSQRSVCSALHAGCSSSFKPCTRNGTGGRVHLSKGMPKERKMTNATRALKVFTESSGLPAVWHDQRAFTSSLEQQWVHHVFDFPSRAESREERFPLQVCMYYKVFLVSRDM